MKSKLSIILVIILISTFISACTDTPEEKSYYEIDPVFEEDKKPESINLIGNNEESQEYFENELAMESLKDHKFYYSDDTYHFVLYFNQNITSAEVGNFMSYLSNTFISMSPAAAIGVPPYLFEFNLDDDSIMKSREKPYRNLSLRVYIDDVRAFRRDYEFDDDLKLVSTSYWENTYTYYLFLKMDTDIVANFIEENKSSGKDITIRKTFKSDGVIMVKIESSEGFKEKYIEEIKSKIENDLAPALEEESMDIYSANYQYLGIVLQFTQNNNIEEEYVYYNGLEENKGWIDVDWMKHGFLSQYSSNRNK
jgi:hypothetical protein